MIIDFTDFKITDERKPSDKLFNEGRISVCYTLKTDDITKGEKPWGTPFIDRTGEFDGGLFNADTQTRLKVERYGEGLLFTAQREGDGV